TATELSYQFVRSNESAKTELSRRVRNSVESFVKSFVDTNFILPLPCDDDIDGYEDVDEPHPPGGGGQSVLEPEQIEVTVATAAAIASDRNPPSHHSSALSSANVLRSHSGSSSKSEQFEV